MRSAILLIQENTIACIERRRGNLRYYVFPGGRMEPGENAEQAAIREAKEELGLDVSLGPLAAIVMFGERHQSYFWASVAGGEFGTGSGPEMASAFESQRGSYTPVWMPLATLSENDVRPIALARALTEGLLREGSATLTLYEER